MSAGPRLRAALRWALAAAVVAFAAGFDWLAGRRGFFAFDQSIPFDAGWRVLSGQGPFRDFVLPVGPVVPWVQAAGFRLFGADYAGYLATGAAVNALAAGAAMALTHRLFPGRWPLWGAAGLLTAIWFQPPAGTPWFEQVAALAGFAGLALLAGPAVAEEPPGRRGRLAAAGAGALVAVAFLAKQNVGLFLVPAFLALLAAPLPEAPRTSRCLGAAWLAGLAAAAGAFALWLALRADPALFAVHFFRIPAAAGLERLLDSPRALVAAGLRPDVFRWIFLGAAALAAAGLAGELRRDDGGDRRLRAAALLALALYAFQQLLWASAWNQREMTAVAPGLLVVLAGGVALAWADRRTGREAGGKSRRGVRAAVALAVAAACGVLGLRGVEAAWSREALDVFVRDRPEVELGVPGLEPLRWAEPTRVTGPASDPAEGRPGVRRTELRELVRTLRGRPGNLFVFPDWTVLYGLLGKPSPQPLLWFHPGLTYPEEAGPRRAALDRAMVEALEAHRVATVVVEEASWLGTGSRLADFPALAAYLEACFRPERRIGLFEIRARDPAGGPACGPAGATRPRSRSRPARPRR